MKNLLVSFHVDSKNLPHLHRLDQFVTDLALSVIPATSHQVLSLCRSVCEAEKAQLLSPLMNSYYFSPQSCSTVFVFVLQCAFMLTDLNDVPDR